MDQNRDKSKIDLGEDLLQKVAPVSTEFLAEGTIEDIFQSARILMQEGFVSDAKSELRKILIRNPEFLEAQKLLQQISETELKNALEGQPIRPTFTSSSLQHTTGDTQELMQRLDQELELGIFADTPPSVKLSRFSLFSDQELLQEYILTLEKELAQASPRDWIDLGVGFLEMELSMIAIRLFSGAQKRLEGWEDSQSQELNLSATSLLALALLQEGKPYEAYSEIQPLLHDLDIPLDRKVELYYLVGRAFESLRKFQMAQEFYSQVIKIDPKYRDTSDRIQKDRMI
jgi:tetratricopeptide (TPR) repeat protein